MSKMFDMNDATTALFACQTFFTCRSGAAKHGLVRCGARHIIDDPIDHGPLAFLEIQT